MLDLGRIDGKIYGVPIAVSIQGLGYNQSALERLGMGGSRRHWSYDEYAAYCAEIHKADANLYGSHDFAARLDAFQMYLLANGQALYSGQEARRHGGRRGRVARLLGPDAQDRRRSPGRPAGAVHRHRVAEQPAGPRHGGLRADGLAGPLRRLPGADRGHARHDDAAGAELRRQPGLLSAAHELADAELAEPNPEEAVKLIDWFVSDPESAKILGLISGPPASKPALQAVLELKDLAPKTCSRLATGER